MPRSLCVILHLHIRVAAAKLVEHLQKPLLARFLALGADYPADVVVLLIGRAGSVALPQPLPFERFGYKVGYVVDRACQP